VHSNTEGRAALQSEMTLTEMLAEKRRNRELMRAQGLLDPIAEVPKEGGDVAPSASKEGKYVPPTRKAAAPGAAPFGDRRDTDPSLRVSNLSENVSDHDLKNLFGNFGDITRVYVAKDRDTNEHRGFAFVNFRHKNQAEDAMRALNGYGYDNMILRVEMAAPREQRP
jgi:translation initiation factor 3 subunit G